MNSLDSVHIHLNNSMNREGSVLMNGAYIAHLAPEISPKIVCVTVDLKTKYALIDAYGVDNYCPFIWLVANHQSVNTNDKVPLEIPTVISFPDFVGWEIFSISNPGRYSFNMTLVKKS